MSHGCAAQLKHVPEGFTVLRDELHPFATGNKLRKLDAVMPMLKSQGVTDVVSPWLCEAGSCGFGKD